MSLPKHEDEAHAAEDQEREQETGEQVTGLPPPPLVPVGPLTEESQSAEPGAERDSRDDMDNETL
jgi:hypothetical protein